MTFQIHVIKYYESALYGGPSSIYLKFPTYGIIYTSMVKAKQIFPIKVVTQDVF